MTKTLAIHHKIIPFWNELQFSLHLWRFCLPLRCVHRFQVQFTFYFFCLLPQHGRCTKKLIVASLLYVDWWLLFWACIHSHYSYIRHHMHRMCSTQTAKLFGKVNFNSSSLLKFMKLLTKILVSSTIEATSASAHWLFPRVIQLMEIFVWLNLTTMSTSMLFSIRLRWFYATTRWLLRHNSSSTERWVCFSKFLRFFVFIVVEQLKIIENSLSETNKKSFISSDWTK